MFRIGTISLIFFLIGSAELKKNILLIVLDDFRPAIKSGYEDFRAHTPYMDKLITKSAIFKRIYAQVRHYHIEFIFSNFICVLASTVCSVKKLSSYFSKTRFLTPLRL